MRIGTVQVRGPSMVPALYDGDCLVVLRGAAVRPGALVVARYRADPSVLVVKRAVRPVDGGWEVASDNEFARSSLSGVADVEARVLFRYWPPRRAHRETWRGSG